jgi:excisionase family DNA binding protein
LNRTQIDEAEVNMDIQPATFTPEEAASYLGVKPATLEVWRSTRRYPDLRYVKVGSRVRYRRTDLDAWLASRTVGKAA